MTDALGLVNPYFRVQQTALNPSGLDTIFYSIKNLSGSGIFGLREAGGGQTRMVLPADSDGPVRSGHIIADNDVIGTIRNGSYTLPDLATLPATPTNNLSLVSIYEAP